MKSRFLFAPIPIFIIASLLGFDVWTGSHWGICLLMTGIPAGCMFEAGRAYDSKFGNLPFNVLTAGMVLLMLLASYVLLYSPSWLSPYTHILFSLSYVLIVLFSCVYNITVGPSENAAGTLMGLGLFTLFSVIYLHGFLLLDILSETPGFATMMVIYLLAVGKGGDSGSYLVGKSIGTVKMTPRLSPNKTWAGLAGGLITGVIIGSGFYFTVIGTHITLTTLLVISFLISLSAAGGDLIGSYLKRGANLDDSSNMFPGLGGVLDMSDSFLVTIPVALLIILLIS